jgi:hypothetical protein
VQFQQRAARIKWNRILDAGHAAHFVEHVIGQRDGIRDRLNRRIHDPDRRTDVDDRGRGTQQNARKQRGHFDHQEHGKRDANQQRGIFRSVIDQKFICNA